MGVLEIVRLAEDAPLEKVIQAVNAHSDVLLGNDGAHTRLVGYDGVKKDPNLGTTTSTGNPSLYIQASGGVHQQVRNSAGTTDMLLVTDTDASGAAIRATTTLTSQGNTTIGTTSAQTLTVNATGTYASPQSFNDAVTLGNAAADALTVNATTTFTSPVTANGTIQFKAPQSAVCSAPLALTTTPTNITGCALNLTPGVWLVIGTFLLAATAPGDIGLVGIGSLAVTGGAATIANATATARLLFTTAAAAATVTQAWVVTVTATTSATLQGASSAASAASAAATHTTITATNA